MLKNYLNIALRNLKKHKQVSLINLFGLTVSIGAFLLIFLFVQYELSYDSYHTNADRTFRVSREWLNQDGETSLHLGHVAPPFGPLLANDFPGLIKKSVRFLNDAPIITYEKNKVDIVEDNFFFADPGAFEIFSWPLLEGNPETILEAPNSIVLSQQAAKRYFGDEDPIGQTLIYNKEAEFQVNGIMADVPPNSHFHPELIASFKAVENFFGREQLMQNWGSNNYSTFLLLEVGSKPEILANQIPSFIDKHLGQGQDGENASTFNKLHLWPLQDIHLHSHLDSEIEANGDILLVYIYSIIAVFILLIACINFINLATARSVNRSREVGVRKAMGAYRKQLVYQFLTESVIISAVALILSVFLVYSFLPQFNNFVQRELSLDLMKNLPLICILVLLVIIVGIVAGSYPAFVLSSYRPATILRGNKQQTGKHPILRSALVVVQFSISIALIIGVVTVNTQLDYVQQKPKGFEGKNMHVFSMNEGIYNNYKNLKEQWLNQEGIRQVSIGSRVPSGRLLDSRDFKAEVGGEMKTATFRVANIAAGHDYLDNLSVEFVAGRNFDINLQNDSLQAFIINESTVAAMGWKSAEEAINKEVVHGGGRKGNIIGVVKDFHFESLHQPISPIVFAVPTGRVRNVLIDIDPIHYDQTMAYLKEQWAFLMPDIPFDHYTIAERFASRYEAEDRLRVVITYFASLAIIIAMLGLIGLASFTTQQRYKEIGIRKVLGASVSQILVLLGRRFTFMVFLSLAIASPIAYWLMDNWLESYAYHDQIPWWSFPLAGVAALLMAWLTISSQTFKAANSNPVKILKD